ncbi:MAG: hypothetical protein ACK4IX_07335, partial [Candidatus Sericytochromatia bacterium]
QILIAKFIDGLISLMKYKDIDVDINTYRTLKDKLNKGIEAMYLINPDNLLTQVVDRISDVNLKNEFLKLIKDKWIFYINSFYTDLDDTSYFSDGYRDRLWDIFIDKNTFFLDSDFKDVKEKIALNLASDVNFMERISRVKETRKKLSSPKSLMKLLSTANSFGDDKVFPSKIQNSDELLMISRIADVVSNHEDTFFDKSVSDSVYRFLIYNLDLINNLNQDLEDKSLLIDSMFNLFSKTVIQKNNFEVQLQESLYSIIQMNFTYLNYKYSKWFFKFYYTYFLETKDDKNRNIEIQNFISSFFDSIVKVDTLIEVIESITTLDLIFGIEEFENVFYNNALDQFDFLESVYEYFSDERKQDIIENWIKSDPIIFNEFLSRIDYRVPNSNKLADYILVLTKDKTDFFLNETRYDILFKLKDLKSYDFSVYSGQIILLIISETIAVQEFGLREYYKNKKYISEFHLKDNCENILDSIFLNNLDSYGQNVKNILITDFGGKKNFVNEIWNKKENFKTNLVDYLFNYVDVDFYIEFNKIFIKSNHIELNKMLINKFKDYDLSNNNIFQKLKPFLEIMIKSKYKNDLNEDMKVLIEKYYSDVKDNRDKIMLEANKLFMND